MDLLELLKPYLNHGLLGLTCLVEALVIRKLYSDLTLSRQETIDALEAHADYAERNNALRKQ